MTDYRIMDGYDMPKYPNAELFLMLLEKKIESQADRMMWSAPPLSKETQEDRIRLICVSLAEWLVESGT